MNISLGFKGKQGGMGADEAQMYENLLNMFCGWLRLYEL